MNEIMNIDACLYHGKFFNENELITPITKKKNRNEIPAGRE